LTWGGVLPKILNGLLDSIPKEITPLYVEGVTTETGGTDFAPYTDSPSWDSALEAFNSGRPVFLKYKDDTINVQKMQLIIFSDPNNYNLHSSTLTWFSEESPIGRDENPWG